MNRSFRRAFSLVEILITLAIVGFIVAIVVVSYTNLRENAENIVQDDSQRSFLRALEAFTSTGGDIGQILTADISDGDKANALLTALKSTADADKRNATGQISSLVGEDLFIIVADPSTTGPRLRLLGDSVALVEGGEGFIVTNDSNLTALEVENSEAVELAASNSLNALDSGALYATNTAYLWDEDDTIIAGPANIGGKAGAVVGGLSGSEIVIAFGDSVSGAPNDTPMAFDFFEYTNGGSAVEIFAYRRDAVDLTTAELDLAAKFNGAPVGSAANAVRNVHGNKIVPTGGTTVRGVVITLPTTSLKAVNTWTASSYSLAVQASATAVGTSRGLGTAAAARTISAIKSPLAAPSISIASDSAHAGILDPGDVVRVDSELTNPTVPSAVYIADIGSSGSELGYYNTVSGSISTLTLK